MFSSKCCRPSLTSLLQVRSWLYWLLLLIFRTWGQGLPLQIHVFLPCSILTNHWVPCQADSSMPDLCSQNNSINQKQSWVRKTKLLHNNTVTISKEVLKNAKNLKGGWMGRSDYGRQQQEQLPVLPIIWPLLACRPQWHMRKTLISTYFVLLSH